MTFKDLWIIRNGRFIRGERVVLYDKMYEIFVGGFPKTPAPTRTEIKKELSLVTQKEFFRLARTVCLHLRIPRGICERLRIKWKETNNG